MLKKLITTSVIALIFAISSLSAFAVDGEIYTGESPDGITPYNLSWENIASGNVTFEEAVAEYYRVDVFRDGTKVGTGGTGARGTGTYIGDLMTESGTYEFIAYATSYGYSDITSGMYAKSEPYEYVRPSETLGVATNLNYRESEDGKVFCTWDAPENWVEGRDFFEVYIQNHTAGRGLLYIKIETPEKEIDFESFAEDLSHLPAYAGGAGDDGIYTFTVKAVSGDITKVTSSEIEARTTVSYSYPDGTIAPVGDEDEPEPTPPVEKPAETVNALSTPSKVVVNGNQISFDAYNINDNNYFKLRDLAFVISGAEQSFDVEWSEASNAINLVTGYEYTAVGGELSPPSNMTKTGTLSTSTVLIDGDPVDLTAYNIDGNNYFKLRDVCRTFNIGVTWDGETSTIGIDTSIGYTE